MFCTKCGSALDKDAQFCSKCGASTEGWTTQAKTQAIPTRESGKGQRSGGAANSKTTGSASSNADELGASSAKTQAMPSAQARGGQGAAYDRVGATQAFPPAQARISQGGANNAGGANWGATRGQSQGAYYGYGANGTAAKTEASMKGPVIALVVAAALIAIAAVVVIFVIRPFDAVSTVGSSAASAIGVQTTQQESASSAAKPNVLPQSSKDSATNSAKTNDSSEDTSSSAAAATSSQDESSSSASAEKTSNDYVLPDSATRYLKESELKDMSLYDLYLARNEIYARHGRGFKNKDLQEYFGNQSWYTERYSPEQFDKLSNQLNDYELKNGELIRKIEKERNSPYL